MTEERKPATTSDSSPDSNSPDIAKLIAEGIAASMPQIVQGVATAMAQQQRPEPPPRQMGPTQQQAQHPAFKVSPLDDDDPYKNQWAAISQGISQRDQNFESKFQRMMEMLDRYGGQINQLGSHYMGRTLESSIDGELARQQVPESFRQRVRDDIAGKVSSSPDTTNIASEVTGWKDLLAQHSQDVRSQQAVEAAAPRPVTFKGEPVDMENVHFKDLDEATDAFNEAIEQLGKGAVLHLDAEA